MDSGNFSLTLGYTKLRLREGASDDSSTRAVAPSSCRDLSLVGHSLDGLYLVQNLDTKKVETVLCDFGTSSRSMI